MKAWTISHCLQVLYAILQRKAFLKKSCIESFALTTFLHLLVQEREAGIYAALCYLHYVTYY